MRMRFAAALGIGVSLLFASPSASAVLTFSCDRTTEQVNAAKTIVIGKAKSIAKAQKGDTWFVRVTYSVDDTLLGKKTTQVVVEETCSTALIAGRAIAPAGIDGFCANPSGQAMPGLTNDGKIASSSA